MFHSMDRVLSVQAEGHPMFQENEFHKNGFAAAHGTEFLVWFFLFRTLHEYQQLASLNVGYTVHLITHFYITI